VRVIGVFVCDATSDELAMYMREEYTGFDADDLELLEALAADVAAKALEMGAHRFLAHLEDSLSNALLITDRTPVVCEDASAFAKDLYHRLTDSET
jgi:hypothetical protein